MRFRSLLILAILALAVTVACGVGLWFFDAADIPDPRDSSAILAVECSTWGSVPSQVTGMFVVQRGSYAAVNAFIDTKNLSLYRRKSGAWVRVTRNGWLHEYDKMAFWKAGAPLFISNALVNGLRREYHRWTAHTPNLPGCR
jgi:hypothetical protein